MSPDRFSIFESPSLKSVDVHRLLNDEISVLRIPNYFSQGFIDAFVEGVRHLKTEAYDHETELDGEKVYNYYGVDRIGKSFNTCYGTSQLAKDAYYAEAMSGTRLIRGLAGESLSPIDRFRLELDETFELGAQVARFEDRPMLAGMTRITKGANSELLGSEPHFDFLPTRFKQFDRQLAANFYLQVPETGGHLDVWPTGQDLTEDFLVPLAWTAQLNVEPVRCHPVPGDLLLFNVRRPHAVHSFTGQDRISLQCFIGHKAGEPLQIWN